MTHTFNVYEAVTQQIIDAMEHSTGEVTLPWHQPEFGFPTNVATGNSYNGINVIALWACSASKRYSQSLWGTYKQWQSVGAQVRKGETSSVVVFYKRLEETDQDNGKEKEVRCVARASRVFNVQQVDGYDMPELEVGDNLVDPIPVVETFVQDTGAQLQEQGARAFYNASDDKITMPQRGLFFDSEDHTATEGWYSVLCHELTHWTGHRSRLDRQLRNRFGSDDYAMEELIAELGAAFLCKRLGISPEPRTDHADYLAHWLKVLKQDSKAIFTAASAAQKATDFLFGAT